jgi:DNA-binding GntR family transcriptional regulator
VPAVGYEVDPDSRAPYYRQIADALRADIRAGRYPPGDYIPTLVVLQEESGRDPKTIRKAIEILADEGLVVVAPGRRTRVLPKAQWRPPP